MSTTLSKKSLSDEVVALSTQLHRTLPSDQVPRKILEIFFERYGEEETYKYVCNISRTDPGSILYRVCDRFPVDIMATMSDEQIFDTIKENFWRICVVRSNIRNFFGIAAIGPLYTLTNSVNALESSGAKMALYPFIEEMSNDELVKLYETVRFNRATETNYKPQTKAAQEISLIQAALPATDTLRGQYGSLSQMFREIFSSNLARPERVSTATAVAEANRRLLWHLLNRLKLYASQYQDTPEYLTSAIQLIHTTVTQIEIGRKSETIAYREVLHDLMFTGVPKDEAMQALTVGNFFSRTRSEASTIAWHKSNQKPNKETACTTTNSTLSKFPCSATPHLNSGGVLLSAS